MSAALALLAVGLLVVLPSWYGSNSVFAYVEAFLTPRQSAEAFALAGLAAALYSRQCWRACAWWWRCCCIPSSPQPASPRGSS